MLLLFVDPWRDTFHPNLFLQFMRDPLFDTNINVKKSKYLWTVLDAFYERCAFKMYRELTLTVNTHLIM